MPRRNELTFTAVALGLVLAVVMGAANVYLGLRVGMTVSASIPAAVVGMALLNGLLRRESVLEANLVQTAASSGEALAAGIIFTMPALVIAGVWKHFDYWTTTLIALSGGMLGILFMIPMRKVFIIDSPELHFPEGVACAEVLKTAERTNNKDAARGSGVLLVFSGLAVGAVFKLVQSYGGLIADRVEWATLRAQRIFFFGADVAPSLVAVGVIIGLQIAAQVFLGGAIAWLVAIPIVSHVSMTPMTAGIEPLEAATELWRSQIRYMGVGAMAVGGIASIWKVRRGLVAAVRHMIASYGTGIDEAGVPETERNMGSRTIVLLSAVTVLLIGAIYYAMLESIPVALAVTAIMVAMSFFFTGVASYIVGLVGNSNSPVSGMTITAVLGTAGLIYLLNGAGLIDAVGNRAIVATLAVAGVVCCVACSAGDVCNDLKTGALLGASPRLQQWLEVVGVAGAAFVMAPVMTVLHEGSLLHGKGGIGVDQSLPAPQAVLFSKLAQGFFGTGAIPWTMVAIGVGIGVGLLLADAALARGGSTFRLHAMPVAVGMYLPFGVSATMLAGGFLHFGLSRLKTATGSVVAPRQPLEKSVLVASGVIAGESLVGVFLGALAYFGVRSLSLAAELELSAPAMSALSAGALILVAGLIFVTSAWRSKIE
jgi:putative OPT family oligopeptide transporter